MMVRTSVMNDDEVKEAKRKLTADRRISISTVKKTESPMSGHENRVKKSAWVIFKSTIAAMAIKLNAVIVTVMRRTIPENLPKMYCERETGLDRTV